MPRLGTGSWAPFRTRFTWASHFPLLLILLLTSLGPIAVYAFYVGMFGPVSIVHFAAEEWGSIEIQRFVDWAYSTHLVTYPVLVFDPELETTTAKKVFELFADYQDDWLWLAGLENHPGG